MASTPMVVNPAEMDMAKVKLQTKPLIRNSKLDNAKGQIQYSIAQNTSEL